MGTSSTQEKKDIPVNSRDRYLSGEISAERYQRISCVYTDSVRAAATAAGSCKVWYGIYV